MRQVYRIRNGVSIIRVYFQPDTNADTDAATIANLAVSDMKDLPPGTLPPVVLKSDASSLSVCLVTTNGGGMSDGALKDVAQNFVRNQLAGVPGASIPPGLRKEGTARSSRRSSLLAAAAPWSLTRRP
jgi:multidrug efflux pump subunit AcrB